MLEIQILQITKITVRKIRQRAKYSHWQVGPSICTAQYSTLCIGSKNILRRLRFNDSYNCLRTLGGKIILRFEGQECGAGESLRGQMSTAAFIKSYDCNKLAQMAKIRVLSINIGSRERSFGDGKKNLTIHLKQVLDYDMKPERIHTRSSFDCYATPLRMLPHSQSYIPFVQPEPSCTYMQEMLPKLHCTASLPRIRREKRRGKGMMQRISVPV